MFAIIIMLAMLVSPGILWHYDYTQIAGLWGFYVLFSIPSMIEVTWKSIKTRSLPKVTGGPSFGLHHKSRYKGTR